MANCLAMSTYLKFSNILYPVEVNCIRCLETRIRRPAFGVGGDEEWALNFADPKWIWRVWLIWSRPVNRADTAVIILHGLVISKASTLAFRILFLGYITLGGKIYEITLVTWGTFDDFAVESKEKMSSTLMSDCMIPLNVQGDPVKLGHRHTNIS